MSLATALQRIIKEKRLNVDWHVLGFGPDHDADLLAQIAGTAGTFQYVRDSTAVAGCVQNLNDLLAQNTTRLETVINRAVRRVKLFAEERNEKPVLIGHLFLTNEELASMQGIPCTLSIGTSSENTIVQPTYEPMELTPSFIDLAANGSPARLLSKQVW